jgi:hypothetical protein
MEIVDREIGALRNIGQKSCFGHRISRAYGMCYEDAPAMQDCTKDFDFEIDFASDGKSLESVIDIYSATTPTAKVFDVEAWDAAKIVLVTPISKDGFRNLARTSRAILSGYAVKLEDGTVIHPIKKDGV